MADFDPVCTNTPGCLRIPKQYGGSMDNCLAKHKWRSKNQRITPHNDVLYVPLNRKGQRNVLRYTAYIQNEQFGPEIMAVVDEFLFNGMKEQTFTFEYFDIVQERDRFVPNPNPRPGDFKFIELFAGIGGFRIGLEAVGGECVFSCELDRHARVVYEQYFGDRPEKDITFLRPASIPEYDLMTAGFPCQSFSSIGVRDGFENEKTGGCFFELMRILRATRPKSFLFENVVGLVECNNGEFLQTVLSEIDKSGYNVQWQVHDTNGVVPQHRERVFFVGFRRDLGDVPFEWPVIQGQSSLRDILLSEEEIKALEPEWKLMLTESQWEIMQSKEVWQAFPESRIVDLDLPARTITSSYRHSYKLHSQLLKEDYWPRPRFFAPREVARIMGFPEDFPVDNERAYRFLGNAVIPPIISLVGEKIKESLATLNEH